MTTTTLRPRPGMTREEKKALIDAWREEDRQASITRLGMVGIVSEKPTLMDRIKGYFVERKIKRHE